VKLVLSQNHQKEKRLVVLKQLVEQLVLIRNHRKGRLLLVLV
jgi:hypothetical protein